MSEIIIHQLSPDSALVFGGVDWQSLIGSQLAKQSYKLARKRRATHFVSAGKHSNAVGTLRLTTEAKQPLKRKLYSAGAAFALSHSNGAVISKTQVEEGDLWYVIAAHDGVVIAGTDIICDAAEAEVLTRSFFQRYANGVEVEGDFDTTSLLNDRTELAPVKTAWQKVPVQIKVLMVAAVALMAADSAWTHWKSYERQKARQMFSAQSYDAHAEWARVLDQWAATTAVDGRSGKLDLLTTMEAIPPIVGHWRLIEGGCSATSSGWTCSARYNRTVLATNASFRAAAPKNWTVTWDGLNNAVGTWTVAAKRQPLDRTKLATAAHFGVNYISKVQVHLPSFRKVEIQSPVEVQIPAPKVLQRDMGGKEVMVEVPYPYNAPDGIERPKSQAFFFNGPLRSIIALPVTSYTSIKQIRFTVDERLAVPNIRESVLTAELSGESYVK
ncbi:type 4b pilus protein PilO2 [Pseudomonas sp. EMN2]|uniref:type 4b pilus protein PilO2 n=1 Tax=Pseudomonas sp. EMN2 TaxID=2615212 RepID=UPI00129A9D56|nr:type 4b pilus protein PilO2 [Pseudomonas sp. EMN2]